MGCSVSRSYDIVTRDLKKPSNSYSLSPYCYSDSSSTPVSTTHFLSTPLVHHPPLCKGDSNHFVSLTSSTYGSLVLDDPGVQDNPTTSPDDCTAINTWELMEDLDHLSPLVVDEIVEHSNTKPLWKHLSEESLLAKMDPNVALSNRKALSSKRFGHQDLKIVTFVESLDDSSTSLSSLLPNSDIYLKGTEDRIVLYFTSLRGIRKTYEDCCSVRMIFKGCRVCVDERDISMDSSYRKELQHVLEGKALSLPQVFIRGKYIGGVGEIKQLHETGELAKLLEVFPVKDGGFTCECCGESRFVPCPSCNGSRKLFQEKEGESMRCPHCNENGLIRCPGCCP